MKTLFEKLNISYEHTETASAMHRQDERKLQERAFEECKEKTRSQSKSAWRAKKRQQTTATAKSQSIERPALTWVLIETPETIGMSMSSKSQLNRVGSIEPGVKGLNTDAEISTKFAGPQLPTV
jgi:hypothetical protein